MFGDVQNELIRVRRLAELSDEPLLVYLIDMAVIQASARARNRDATLQSLLPEPRNTEMLKSSSVASWSLLKSPG